MTTRQDPTRGDERSANQALADNSTGGWAQQVNQPPKERRGVAGGGIVRAVIAVLLVGGCAVLVFGGAPW